MIHNTLLFFENINYMFSIPGSLLLFGTAVFLTCYLKAIQIRCIPRFFHIISTENSEQQLHMQTINRFYALFNAISGTLGMGSIIGPSFAIVIGGPGALFWLLAYTLISSVIKYTEVTFALHFRKTGAHKGILGGPMQYLTYVHPLLATWYTYAMIVLLASWSSLQANTLADILHNMQVPYYVTGLGAALFIFYILEGGAKRAGILNSALVPLRVILYITSSSLIIYNNAANILPALHLVIIHAFSPIAAIGGFMGASTFTAFRSGTYKGALITESGLGTSSIQHSLADTRNPQDQGILAMTSALLDSIICCLSGLMVLTTNAWQTGTIGTIVMYNIFQTNFPDYGTIILILSLFLFIIGTLIGNSLNGQQIFGVITEFRYMRLYTYAISLIIFLGSITNVPLVWAVMESILPFVAIPHILGLLYLSIKYKNVITKV
jgi:alanine or glycine:cation symporter, AGCS family